jgi:hypothetical protein
MSRPRRYSSSSSTLTDENRMFCDRSPPPLPHARSRRSRSRSRSPIRRRLWDEREPDRRSPSPRRRSPESPRRRSLTCCNPDCPRHGNSVLRNPDCPRHGNNYQGARRHEPYPLATTAPRNARFPYLTPGNRNEPDRQNRHEAQRNSPIPGRPSFSSGPLYPAHNPILNQSPFRPTPYADLRDRLVALATQLTKPRARTLLDFLQNATEENWNALARREAMRGRGPAGEPVAVENSRQDHGGAVVSNVSGNATVNVTLHYTRSFG